MRASRSSSDHGAVALVTGATGFLGGAIAAELLMRKPHVRALFLVRASDARSGLRALRQSIARFEPGRSALARLTEESVFCGDLESFPLLTADPRASTVTHVLNCAALVSFSWKREVWRTNVEHTTAFAECVARLPALRRVLHVSTAMVSGGTTNRMVSEDDFPGAARQFTLYTKSKAEIERRLPGALNGALVIARPSIIVGHTRIGCNASASLFWLFRMIHAARRLPFSPLRRIDIVPVDYCARALVHLMLKDDLAHDRYHISAGPDASCSFSEIDTAYSRARGEADDTALQVADFENMPMMADDFHTWFGPCDAKRAASAIKVYRAFAGLNVTFDNARLLAEGIASPPRFADYLDACVRTGERETIAEQMTHDAR